MKLVSSFLESIGGIQIYYVSGLLIFFILFVVILVRTLRRPDQQMNENNESILNDNDSEESLIS